VLRAVAERITACLRRSDTVARLGGDEFVILLHDGTESDDGAAVLTRIATAIALPLDVGAQHVAVTCSMGCSSFPEDGATPEALLRAADTAMYQTRTERRQR
jgi:diguanylate cyclase (GGDEF)-like protein